MIVLDLFAGTRSICKAFEEFGHDSYAVEIDRRHDNIDWYTDIMNVTADDVRERIGTPDVIWASPPCTTYSIAGISHHRRKVSGQDHLEPVSKYAILSDELVLHTLKLIAELRPKYFFIENPRGGLRKMDFMQDLPRHTITYCQYGDFKMKPTDIWTNHPNPNFLPMCKNGDTCHVSAPRGSKHGTQAKMSLAERSKVPHDLCLHIAKISEG
jgi:site-specific DNA-cytosine methylase